MYTHAGGQICGLVQGIFVGELGVLASHFNIFKLHSEIYN